MHKLYTILLISIVPLCGISQTFTSFPAPFLDTGDYVRGISWVDIDNDNDLDVYLSGNNGYDATLGATLPMSVLYTNNGNGTFSPTNEIQSVNSSMGHGFGDFDNDGNIDLLLAKTHNWGYLNEFYVNNGGTFTMDNTTGLTPSVTSPFEGTVSWGDYDNDGYLDMYIVRWNVQTNRLFHNNGNGTFTQITSGPMVTDAAWSSSGIWGDLDNDNDLDLVVGNYSGTANKIYVNNGNGTFTTLTGAGSILTDAEDTREINLIDFNNDGYLDVFAANQNGQNRLYQNNGNMTFTDVHTMGNFSDDSWCSNWADFDNDGDLDLISLGFNGNTDNRFLRNDGNSFTSINPSNVLPTAFSGSMSTSACFTDFDNDGWMDLHISYPSISNPDYFYRNDGTDCMAWIEMDLTGTASNHDGIGAKIAVKANIGGVDKWQYHWVSAQNSKVAHNMQRAHFGLETATVIDSLVVQWPSGTICNYTNIEVNQIINLSEDCTYSVIVPPADPDGQHTSLLFCSNDPDTVLFFGGLGGNLTSNCSNFDTATGVYSPANAGTGVCEVYYTIPGLCGYTDTISVETFNAPEPPVVLDTTLCLNTGVFNLTAIGNSGTINWYDDPLGTNLLDTGAVYSPVLGSTAPVTFYVTQSNGSCSSLPAPLNVTVGSVTAQINTTSSTSGTPPLPVDFNGSGTGTGTLSYNWNFGDGNTDTTQNPTHVFNTPGTYPVVLTVNDSICFGTDTLMVDIIEEDSYVTIPNIFSPNNDGNNDQFKVSGTNIIDVKVDIYNRWGQKLYSWNGLTGFWDGTLIDGDIAPEGTYYYLVEATGKYDVKHSKNGPFSLVR